MQPVPRIFVSATSRDLRTARGLVSEGLRRMECLPIVQDDFPPDYKSVRDMLRAKISECNAVVHLAGFYYGAEPQPVFPGPDRRSFTQMEYEIAVELKLPCYVFLCGKDFPFDPHEAEAPDKQQLQLEHRDRLLKRDELFYEFATPEELANRTRELQLSVEGLRKELARERSRRRLAMGAAVAALVIAIGGGIWLTSRQKVQEKVNQQQSTEIATQSDEIANLRAQLEGPWAIVNKVNAAASLLRQRSKAPDAEIQRAAIELVAADLKKTPEEIKRSIDAATQLAQQLLDATHDDKAAKTSTVAQKTANHLLQAETLMKLAASHEAAGATKLALETYQKAFALLDPQEHPEQWLNALTSIANLEDTLGMNSASIADNEKAIAFGEATPALGIGHEYTVYAVNNLLYHYRYTEPNLPSAEALLRRTLTEREKILGPDDAETLRAKGDLAEVLADQKKYDEAAELSAAALKGSERVFGADDDVTTDILANLASIDDDKGDLKKAITLQRRVVAAREKSLGADDAYALSNKETLANMLDRDDDLKEAAKVYTELVETRTESAGPDDADTLSSMSSLADVLGKEEDYAGAEKIARKVLAAREKTLGPDHQDTLDITDSIARFRWNQDDLPGADKLFRHILEVDERTVGAKDPATIEAANSVGDILSAEEKYDEAEPLYRRVLAGREAALPADDPQIAAICFSLASTLSSLDKKDEALPLAKRAVEIGKKTLPKDDETLTTYTDLVTELSQ